MTMQAYGTRPVVHTFGTSTKESRKSTPETKTKTSPKEDSRKKKEERRQKAEGRRAEGRRRKAEERFSGCLSVTQRWCGLEGLFDCASVRASAPAQVCAALADLAVGG